jgi:hypothetical protein
VDTTGANISRTYLTFEKKIDRTWSAKVTLDSLTNNVFLKKAQLTGKFSDALNVKLGMIETPWIDHEDNLNGHRYISKSFVESHAMASPADVGVGIFGKADMLSYDIVSINGSGYGNTAVTAKTDLEARFGIKPIDGLTVDLGYRSGYLGQYNATVTEKKNTLTQLLLTYGQEGKVSFRGGANFISNKVDDQLAITTLTQKGTELWAWVRSGKFGGYLRSESLDNGAAGAATEKRTVVSVDYLATKSTVISLVSDSATDIGGTAGKKASTVGLFTQFKF